MGIYIFGVRRYYVERVGRNKTAITRYTKSIKRRPNY